MRHKRLITAVLLAGLISGCTSIVPGVRFVPGEEQKQAADAAHRLTTGLAYTGVEPGSRAAEQMGKLTGPASMYIGPPEDPKDVSPFVKAEAGKWDTLKKRADAYELKESLAGKTTEIVSDKLADLAGTVKDAAKVGADSIIHRTQSIVDFASMSEQLSQEVKVPEPKEPEMETLNRLTAIEGNLDRIREAADAQAARRPTAEEISEKAREGIQKATDEADKWLGFVDKEILPWLAMFGIGGGGLGLNEWRKRRKAEKSAQDEHSEREREKAMREAMAAFAGANANAGKSGKPEQSENE